ncbi:hypothetical protein [Sebaldella sp. S0638]|uniref:hypothetical protein n=1 Tax=Sebaldella sp. S0638 TaxID=2957809 RepID=UPI00209F8080|nr:hypothetical protein [Sebaldella sp. S0638]MCP1223182.1 hypothetical protein [Sebaldella sp. S0638]
MKKSIFSAFIFILFLNTISAASFSFTENRFIEDHTNSESSKNSKQNEILKRYKKFEKLLSVKKQFTASDIFLPEELNYYSLKKGEKIFLDRTNIGILVSCSKRTLFLIPSDIKYSETGARSDRS